MGTRVTTVSKCLVVPLALVGCGEPSATAAGTVEVRDSAGIAMIRSAAEPAWSEAEAWRVREDLVVGGEGEGAPVFGYVSDLAVDDVGRIYVLDQQAREVLVFDASGAPRGSLAGPGEGPGEIGPLAGSILVRGDTVLVADWAQDRLTRLSRDGSVVSTEPIPGEGGARTWWAATGSGVFYRSLGRYTDERGRWAGRDALLRHVGEGRADTVLVFEYPESDLGGPSSPNVPLIVHAPSWTVWGDGRVVWVKPGDPRVYLHGADGTLESVIAFDGWAERATTPEQVAVLEEKLGDRLEMLGGSRDLLDQLPVEAPGALPAITSVEAGPEGTLWVQRMGSVEEVHPMALNTPDPPRGLGGPTWDVFDGEWRFLGTVTLPSGFRLMRITGEAVYGVGRDALDVDRVVRLLLDRGSG